MAVFIALAVGAAWLAALFWSFRRRAGLFYDLLAGGALVLLVMGFFWRTLTGDVYQPADGGDLVSFLFPTYRFAARELAAGHLPLWNPHLYGGAPFIADIQAGFLYLPNLLLFGLNPSFDYRALQWLAIGHLFWAALGMYVLLRTLRWPDRPVARPAALLGSLAFALSDPLLIHLGNLNLVAVLSWLPWTLAAYAHGLTSGRLRWLAVAGLLFAVGNFAGHAQSSLYLGLALALYTLLWAVCRRPQGRSGVGWGLWTGGRLAAVLLLAGLLSAPIVLPALELAGYTERTGFTYQDTVAFSLAPAQLVGLITPGFFGRGPALHWSLWQRVETPYAGVAALLLAAAALLLAPAARRRALWPWVGMALFGLATALGIYALLHGWLTLLPGFAQMRAPARSLVLWTLGVAVLAAVGLDVLLAQGRQATPALRGWLSGLNRGLWLLLGVALPLSYLALLLTQESETAFLRASLAVLALVLATLFWAGVWALAAGYRAGWWSGRVLAGLMVGLLYFDLAATGAYTDISPTDPTQGFDHPEIVAFLRQDPDRFRIDTRTEIEGLWQPDTAALAGLEDVGGIANPLALRAARAQWEATGGRQTRLYDMLNAKYVIVRDGTPLPEGKFEPALDAPGELAVYRNRTVLPRAWVVHEVAVAPTADAAWSRIQAPGFEPSQTVVLVQDEGTALPPVAPPDPAQGADLAVVADYTGSRMTLQVETTGAAVLVLSEMWYPGWQATVNGTPAAVLPANGALRAVVVPAGVSTVELWFAPSPWRWGLALAALGLLAALALVWVDGHRGRNIGQSA